MPAAATLRRFVRYGLALVFVAGGVMHFVTPASYVAVMPPYIPAPRAMVFASGIAELLGGLGLLVPATRRLAAWGLAAMLTVFLLAHVYMARHPGVMPFAVPVWALWLRLALQLPLIAAVLWAGEALDARRRPGRG